MKEATMKMNHDEFGEAEIILSEEECTKCGQKGCDAISTTPDQVTKVLMTESRHRECID
jgi:hypothetical protein